jgi:hypothetical protein
MYFEMRNQQIKQKKWIGWQQACARWISISSMVFFVRGVYSLCVWWNDWNDPFEPDLHNEN